MLFYATDTPFNVLFVSTIATTSHCHLFRDGGKKGIKEQMTYCLDDKSECYSIKGNLPFCSNAHSPHLCFVRIDTMPHHDSRRPLHTNPALCTPLQPTDESEVAACLLASLHGTRTTYLCCCLSCHGPKWPVHYRGDRSYRAFTL